VQSYRIFIFDREHRFAGIELADFPTDDDALARAAELLSDQHGAEVWQFGRIVGQLAPRSAPMSAQNCWQSQLRKKAPAELGA
jgi:hypothetical protein